MKEYVIRKKIKEKEKVRSVRLGNFMKLWYHLYYFLSFLINPLYQSTFVILNIIILPNLVDFEMTPV